MLLSYTPGVGILVAHLDHQQKSSPLLRRSRQTARILLIVAFALVLRFILISPGDLVSHARGAGVTALGLLLVLAVARPASAGLRRFIWRRTLAGPRAATLRAPRTLTVEADGLRVRAPQQEVFTSWEGIYEVTELPSVVLVQVGPMAAHVIPRRAFAGEEERAAFVAEIRSHLPR